MKVIKPHLNEVNPVGVNSKMCFFSDAGKAGTPIILTSFHLYNFLHIFPLSAFN